MNVTYLQKYEYQEDVPEILGHNELSGLEGDAHTAQKLGRHDGNVSLTETTLPEQ